MSWEKRRQGVFYYRSRRVGSRVRKTYCGNGPLAVLVAEQDELGRAAQVQEKQRQEEQQRQLRLGLEVVDQALDQLDSLVDGLITQRKGDDP